MRRFPVLASEADVRAAFSGDSRAVIMKPGESKSCLALGRAKGLAGVLALLTLVCLVSTGAPGQTVRRIQLPLSAPAKLDTVKVTGREDNLVGIATSANQGTVGAKDLAMRPLLRAGEIVENVPGVIVTQHSGSGKANQYFLRGFNLDHGTDLALGIDGVPVNMPSHAHGQGYADLNFIIPELIERVDFEKGPYYADVGDFGSAGSFDMHLYDRLPAGFVHAEGGQSGAERVAAANNAAVGSGNVVYGGEFEHNERTLGPGRQRAEVRWRRALHEWRCEERIRGDGDGLSQRLAVHGSDSRSCAGEPSDRPVGNDRLERRGTIPLAMR